VRGISWGQCFQERRQLKNSYRASARALVRGISWGLCLQERRQLNKKEKK